MQTQQSIIKKWNFPDRKSLQNSLRKFGSFMAGMIMPIIGVIIAWGFFTAIILGVKTGIMQNQGIDAWTADHSKTFLWNMDYIVNFGISSVIPLLVGFFGGKQIYKGKGAIIGIIATMGVIAGSYSPLFNQTMVAITGNSELLTASPPVMILGAMIAGPVAAIIFKHLEKLWVNRIPSGFEMLINNLAIGLIGLLLMFASFWSLSLLSAVLQSIFYLIIKGLNENKLLWLMPMFIETEKILFLNNAVNHGILGPLGLDEVQRYGQSALFFLDPNPGTGMGLLLAYFLFGKRDDKTQAAAAMPVHFIGGIHEVYYPFVLVKPLNLLWLIAGGTFAAAMYQAFDVGGLFTPSPGSIIMNYIALNPKPMNYAGLSIAIFGSLAITCALTSAMLIVERLQRNERIYFNPKAAMLMGRVTRLMNTKDAVTINKTKPIAGIKYVTNATQNIYEWEIVNYTDGSKEEFINLNDSKKINKFAYLDLSKTQHQKVLADIKNKNFDLDAYTQSEITPTTKTQKYLFRIFANGKQKLIKVRKTDKIFQDVNYEKRTLQNTVRTIDFKPVTNKRGKTFTPKSWVQKVWYLNKQETLDDLVAQKKPASSTASLASNHTEILKTTDKILFACEAGMGSSAMGAGIVRKMLKDENILGINVMNFAIKDLPPNAKVIICQNIFKDLVEKNHPEAYVYTIEQFLKKTEYENLIDKLNEVRKPKA